ncbi:MAG TPA: PDZ domain-containing protein [Longimicrobiales bacterium]|nr:PDZ domain-containing protein [Longimicrobiales bacterium]
MRKIALALILIAGYAASANAQVRTVYIGREKGGYLGIRFRETTTIDNESRTDRVMIAEVSKDSPAEKAGLKSGDEVLRVNGLVASYNKFSALAQTLEEGDTVKLHVKRTGGERDFVVVAGKRPNDLFTYRLSTDTVRHLMRRYLDSARVHLDSLHLPDITIFKNDSMFDVRVAPWKMMNDSTRFKRDSMVMRLFREQSGDKFREMLPEVWGAEAGPGMIFRSYELGSRSIGGAELTEVDPAMIDILKTDRGLLTLRVAPETPASRAGLQPGDVIVKANARDVRTVDELRSYIRGNAEPVKLEVLRKGTRRTLELKTRGR